MTEPTVAPAPSAVTPVPGAPAPAASSAAAPPEASAPPQVEVHDDPLRRLVHVEIPRHKERLRTQGQLSPEGLQQEIHGTVMPLVAKLGAELFQFRDWSVQTQLHNGALLDDALDRIEQIEGLLDGSTSQLTMVDATLFAQLIAALEGFVEQSMSATTNAEGREQLAQLAQLCIAGKQRIEETTMDDDDEAEPEAPEAQPSATVPLALSPPTA